MVYVPRPWQSMPKGGVQRPVSLQTNVILPPDVNNVDQASLQQVAESIVESQSSRLDRFVANGRQQNSLSERGYDSRQIDLDGMTARWSINQGQEKLTLDITPVSGGGTSSQSSETNLDGYIAWIHAEPYFPDNVSSNGHVQPGYVGPYNIFMNGVLIAQDYMPQFPVGGYPILFGRTALLCPSYIQDKDDIDINQSLQRPNTIIPPNGWGNYKAGSFPDGAQQQQYPKEFGYWILDWVNEMNNGDHVQSALSQKGPTQWQDWNTLLTQVFGGVAGKGGPPVFDKGVYFKNAGKSPLKPKGMNNMGVRVSPDAPLLHQGGEVFLLDVFIAEFYDRSAYRAASQSWTLAAQPTRKVLLNDRPTIYMTGAYSTGFVTSAGGNVDLTPSVQSAFVKAGGTNDPTKSNLIGPHDGLKLNGFTDGVTFTALQQSAITAWENANREATQAFSNTITSQIAAWSQKWTQLPYAKLLDEAQEMRGLYSELTDANGDPLPFLSTNYFTYVDINDKPQTAGFLQQYYFHYQTGASQPALVPYYIYSGSSITTQPFPPITGTTPADYYGSGALTYLAVVAQIKAGLSTDAVSQQYQEYEAIVTQKAPGLQPFPNIGDNIGQFDYGNISISGSNWSYEQ